MSLLAALNAGNTSLEVNQKSIEVTGNNIANVNTVGYSRQEVVLDPRPSLNIGGFFVGNGVQIVDIQREHDIFIERQVQFKAVEYGYEESKTRSLSELERIFAITDENLSTEIDNFFDSFQELSADPGNVVMRNTVLLQGNVVSTSFNNIVAELDSISANIDYQLNSKVGSINDKLAEIAELNQRIQNIEVAGQSANGPRDRRDLLTRDLAITLGAESIYGENGMVSLSLPGGLPLVQGSVSMSLETVTTGTQLELQLRSGGTTVSMDGSHFGGEFKGLYEMRDQFVPSVMAEIDKLAYEFSTQVNIQHMAGAGLDSSTGHIFFNQPPNYVASPPGPQPGAAEYLGAARALKVDLTDPNKVAAAQAPTPPDSVAPGDNRNALIISNIGDNYTLDGEDFNAMYATIASRIGVESNQNQLAVEGASDALVQLENYRDSLVAVSLEEEMINIIKFQRGFESSAKFLSIVDEMMVSIINLKR